MPSAYAPAVGGVEVLTARLAHHLLRRGHAVEVWSSRSEHDDLPEHEVIDGVTVRRFIYAMPRADVRALAGTPAAALRTVRGLRRAVREFSPTHLHVQCFSGNGAYATLLSVLTGTPLIITLQGETVMDDHDIYDRSTSLRAALRLGLRRADRVTACSHFTLADARSRFGLDPRKASVIFNGVDPDEIEPESVQVPFERYVLALGRVVRKKGFDLLIDAFAQVAPAYPEAGLVIGGVGAQRDALLRQAQSLGLGSRVHLTGRLNRAQVASVMRGAELFVMPSRVEPFGIVALEAWRAGVPAVVTSRGGAGEFVLSRQRGLVVDPERTDDLAEAIRSLLADPALRLRLQHEASLALPDFTWDRLSEQYEAVYA